MHWNEIVKKVASRRLCGVTLAALALYSAFAANSSQIFSKNFGPKNIVRLSRPTIRWQVWTKSDQYEVGVPEVKLNDQVVPANYDPKISEVSYTPPNKLPVGPYSVKVVVPILAAGKTVGTVKKDWNFSISSEAIDELPTLTKDQEQILVAVNKFRARLGLPNCVMDNRLAAAALAHSEFLELNHIQGHFQKQGMPGFFGISPSERLESYGFLDDSWEVVSYGLPKVEDAVQNLFDAPYHRLPFMQPGVLSCGGGNQGVNCTVEFSRSTLEGSAVSPANGEKDVKVSWFSRERPDPLRIHADLRQHLVGYPVVLAAFGDYEGKLVVDEAKLTTGGQEVKAVLNQPSNDEKLTQACVLIPVDPLKKATKYAVSIKAHLGSKDFSQEWSFTTAAK